MIRTNERPAVCEHCGLDLGPGEGFVFRCLLERCKDPKHVAAGGGWHIVCGSILPCHGRAKKLAAERHPKPSKEELKRMIHESLQKLEGMALPGAQESRKAQERYVSTSEAASVLRGNQALLPQLRESAASALLEGVVVDQRGLGLTLSLPSSEAALCSRVDVREAIRASVAACFALDMEEFLQVTVEVTYHDEEVAA